MIALTEFHAAEVEPSFRVNSFGPGFMETESTLSWGDWKNGPCERVHTQTTMKLVSLLGELAAVSLWLAADDGSNMAGSFIMCEGGLKFDRRLI
jgi:3-oxoacyl-[acyl-carrier protein] reductase